MQAGLWSVFTGGSACACVITPTLSCSAFVLVCLLWGARLSGIFLLFFRHLSQVFFFKAVRLHLVHCLWFWLFSQQVFHHPLFRFVKNVWTLIVMVDLHSVNNSLSTLTPSVTAASSPAMPAAVTITSSVSSSHFSMDAITSHHFSGPQKSCHSVGFFGHYIFHLCFSTKLQYSGVLDSLKWG